MRNTRTGRLARLAAAAAGVSALGFGVLAGVAPAFAASGPVAAATPSAHLQDQDVLSMQGSGFDPYSEIQILECEGTVTSPPRDATTCDGRTLDTQAFSDRNGNFINAPGDANGDNGYTVYMLPGIFRDSAGATCDSTHACVLYVGEDHNNFSAPHTWVGISFNGTNASTTTLTCPAKVAANTSGTCSASVTGSSGTATGTLTLSASQGTISTTSCTLTNGSCSFTVNPSNPATADSITAAYPGDVNYRRGSGTTTVSVGPIPTTLTAHPAILSVGSATLYLDESATLLDNSGDAVASRSVVFSAGGSTICRAMTNAQGVAACDGLASTNQPAGVQNLLVAVQNQGYSASFSGDALYAPSTGQAGPVS